MSPILELVPSKSGLMFTGARFVFIV